MEAIIQFPAFFPHLRITFFRLCTGFLIALALGTLLGLSAYLLKINTLMETFLILFQVIPGVILGIIFMLMLGMGSSTPVLLIIILVLPFITINTMNSLLKKNSGIEDMIRSFNGTWRHIVTDHYIPLLIPAIKTNAVMEWIMAMKIVVLGEFIAAENGLGYLMHSARIYFNMKEVFFYLLTLLIMTVGVQIIINGLFIMFLSNFFHPDT